MNSISDSAWKSGTKEDTKALHMHIAGKHKTQDFFPSAY